MAVKRNYVLLFCLVIVCLRGVVSGAGSCTPTLTCDFTHDLCHFTTSGAWTVHPTSNSQGHHGYAQLHKGTNSHDFDLTSPVLCPGQVEVKFSAVFTSFHSSSQVHVLTSCDGRDLAGQPLHGLAGTTIYWRTVNITLPACPSGQRQQVTFRGFSMVRSTDIRLDDVSISTGKTVPMSTTEQPTTRGITTSITHDVSVTRLQPVSHTCRHSKSLSCGFDGKEDPACGFHGGHNWRLGTTHTGHCLLYDASRGTFHDTDLYSPPLCSGILQVTFSAFAFASFGQPPTLSVFTNCSSLDQQSVNTVVGTHGSVQHVTWKNYTFYLSACSDSEATVVVFHVSHPGTRSYVGLDNVSIQQATVSAIPTTSTTTTTTITPSATASATNNTTTSAVTKPPSVCERCHNVQCFNGPESVTCTQEQPHCASRVVDSTDGERVVFKGCISQAECEAWVPNLLQRQNCHLVNQHVTGYDLECLFCCHGDLCNGGPGYIPHPDTQIGHSDQLDLIG